MSETLYRKYRPGRFDELIGQNHIKTTLQAEIKSGTIAHAYLFSGPRGTGKTTVARLLAKSLNCADRKKTEGEPCGKCQSCLEIASSRSMDLIEIDAASNTGVDNVRENIIENVRFTPYRDKYKVFVIDEVHMLSTSAFNALLKTLEEPPEHIVFVLATTELYKLPETIISRCQRFDFKKIDAGVLFDYLKKIAGKEGVQLDDEILKTIAVSSGGYVRDSLSTLGQILSLGSDKISFKDVIAILPRTDHQQMIEMVDLIHDKNVSAAVGLVNTMVDEGVDLERFVLDLIEYLRTLYHIKLKVNGDNSLMASREQIDAQAEKMDLALLMKAVNVLIDRLPDLKNSDIVQLPLEMGILEICGMGTEVEEAKPTVVSAPVVEPKKTEEVKEDVKEVAKEVVKEEVTVGDIVACNTDLQGILDKWKDIISASRGVNHSVAVALQTAHPVKLDKNVLTIAFEHAFYCERFKEKKSRGLIEQVLKNVLNCDLMVACQMVDDKMKEELKNGRKETKQAEDEKLNSVLEDFGGKVVG